jgi:hypothetical protein
MTRHAAAVEHRNRWRGLIDEGPHLLEHALMMLPGTKTAGNADPQGRGCINLAT